MILWFHPQTLAWLSLMHPNFSPKGSETLLLWLVAGYRPLKSAPPASSFFPFVPADEGLFEDFQ